MMRAAIYARYSSDSQREASIEDQVRLCREAVEADIPRARTHINELVGGDGSRGTPMAFGVLAHLGSLVTAEKLGRAGRWRIWRVSPETG